MGARYRRADVVARAVDVLDRYGLGDLSMRRLANEMGVQPSALYHHFENKQALLAALADEILARRPYAPVPDAAWDVRVGAVCHWVRDAVLAYSDGAEVVATAYAFRLGGAEPYDALVAALRSADLPDDVAAVGARTLLHFVFGHVADEQTHLQAASAGALADAPRDSSDFDVALSIVLDGLRVRRDALRP